MRVLGSMRFLAVLAAGLTAGILFGDRMGVSFARRALSPSSFVSFQQVLHEHFVPLMPILILTSVVTGLAWLVLGRSTAGRVELVAVLLAVVGFIAVFVLTRLVNVPINVQLMSWDAASPPADVTLIWARWEATHTIRTSIAVAGFALEVLALGKATNAPAA